LIVSLLVAMDDRRGIGYENRLPWRLSADLKRFKALTMGHHMIMGRRTYESIGKPLPGRTSIVLTRNPEWRSEGVIRAGGLEEALEVARRSGEDEAFIIGGGVVFVQALDLADRIYLTEVRTDGPADTFFPEYEVSLWEEVHCEKIAQDENNQFPTVYRILERKRGSGFF
jgi:dihydrofolate reductase